MVSIFHLGSDVSWRCQPPPEVGRSSQRPWEPGKVALDHDACSRPGLGRPGEEDGPCRSRPGAALDLPAVRALLCSPPHPRMTRPPNFLGKTKLTHVHAHPQMLPSQLTHLARAGCFQANPNREGGAGQAGGTAGWAPGNFHLDFQSPTEGEGEPGATQVGRKLDKGGAPWGRRPGVAPGAWQGTQPHRAPACPPGNGDTSTCLAGP